MPQGRPSIPAEVQRAVFIESGHRCAVCGESMPLERAHIVPFRRSSDHSAANLVCLCANCHERADRESWGESTLRAYKDDPWVNRRFRIPADLESRPADASPVHQQEPAAPAPRQLEDLFDFLAEQRSPESGELRNSLTAKLVVKNRPSNTSLRLREESDFRRTVTFLRAADFWLNSANCYGEEWEAMVGAGLVYAAIRDVLTDTLETWWFIHSCAYALFVGVLDASFGLRLRLSTADQRRLYDVASEMTGRLGPEDDPIALETTEPLLILMKEFRQFLER